VNQVKSTWNGTSSCDPRSTKHQRAAEIGGENLETSSHASCVGSGFDHQVGSKRFTSCHGLALDLSIARIGRHRTCDDTKNEVYSMGVGGWGPSGGIY